MDLIVHFAFGAAMGLPFISMTSRVKSSTIVILSGFWAILPDGSKFVAELGPLHDTVWSNVFWLHGVIDSAETGSPKLEAFVALLILAMMTMYSETVK